MTFVWLVLWLLFCFIYLNWYKHRFLHTEMLLCCKETGLWVRRILFQCPASIVDHKAKHYRECSKQGTFFRWENPKIVGRKQFVPFSDSWTRGCQRMAGCSRPLSEPSFPCLYSQTVFPLSFWLTVVTWSSLARGILTEAMGSLQSPEQSDHSWTVPCAPSSSIAFRWMMAVLEATWWR